jgi:flagellar motility protein MotE (MotC chaperone)
MKNLKNIIPIVGSLVVSLLAIAVLIAMVLPLVDESEIIPLVADSTAQASADSAAIKNEKPVADSTAVKTDHATKHEESPKDSGNAADKTIEKLKQHNVATVTDAQVVVDTLSDGETKKMVQIFESMDAESAARILKNMDDFAVRQVLTSMKRRQSAKILAELEPKRAAKILKGKEQ